jgi:DNA-binding transcriptional MocR family regulator
MFPLHHSTGTLRHQHVDYLTMQDQTPINLSRGWPATSLLPVNLIRAAANAALSDPETAYAGLSYGPDPGYEPARDAIAAWLTRFYRPMSAISAERICITGGASQNIGSLLSVYTDPEYTRNIWIVAPAYFLGFRIFEDAGFTGKMRAVPEDGEGLDIAFLEREMNNSEALAKAAGNTRPRYTPERGRAKVYKHMIYCVPTFANPSSRTMTLDRRRALVQLARRYDALLVADDVYDCLQWHADPYATTRGHNLKTAHLPRLVDLDREIHGGAERNGADGFGNACSNGSFSKIAGPGIRCGWLEGTKKLAYGVSQT